MGITFCARLDNRDNGFLQIDNRVVENNYTDLSMEAYMVLTRCLANQSGWQIHWNHFEKKYHISSKKRGKAMNELVEKRHCIIQKIRNGSAWNYYYFFFELALSESETEDFIKNFLPNLVSAFWDVPNESSQMGVPKWGAYIIYNNINKTNLNNTSSNKNTYTRVLEKNLNYISNTCDSIDSCKHVTCDMNSPNNSTFSKNLNKHDNMENFDIATNLNKSSNFVTKPSVPKVKKSHKQFQQTNYEGTVIQNKMEYQMSQESKSLSEINKNTKGALDKHTEEEQALSKVRDLNNQVQETLSEINAKKRVSKKAKKKREEEIFSLIEQDFTGDLQVILHDYFDFLIQEGKPLYAANYRAMIRNLEDLAEGDDKKKEAIVNQSLARGWQGFYALKDNSNTQKTWKNVQPVLAHQDEDEPEIKEFRDENGNLITFG